MYPCVVCYATHMNRLLIIRRYINEKEHSNFINRNPMSWKIFSDKKRPRRVSQYPILLINQPSRRLSLSDTVQITAQRTLPYRKIETNEFYGKNGVKLAKKARTVKAVRASCVNSIIDSIIGMQCKFKCRICILNVTFISLI